MIHCAGQIRRQLKHPRSISTEALSADHSASGAIASLNGTGAIEGSQIVSLASAHSRLAFSVSHAKLGGTIASTTHWSETLGSDGAICASKTSVALTVHCIARSVEQAHAVSIARQETWSSIALCSNSVTRTGGRGAWIRELVPEGIVK